MTNFAKELYYIGSHSGRDEDQFTSLDLNWQNGTAVAPISTDCPINIECSIYTSYKLGACDLIIGKVEAVHPICQNRQVKLVQCLSCTSLVVMMTRLTVNLASLLSSS